MYNLIADSFLYFSQPTTIAAFLIAAYFISTNKNYSIQLAALCALGILVNVVLKGYFKVPLASFISHPGFAFPSGHTQFATVFYGYIAFFGLPNQIDNKKHTSFITRQDLNIRIIISSILICGIGFGLVHYHYHTIGEVIAGFVAGMALLFLYRYALLRFTKTFPYIILITASALLGITYILYTKLECYVWVAYFIACVTAVGLCCRFKAAKQHAK